MAEAGPLQTNSGVRHRCLTPMEALAARKDVIADLWLARTLETYPERTARFLAREADPFRNPVGHTLKEAFPALVDELLGAMDPGRVTTLLDGIVRIRAVQDFTPSQAVAFVFLLRKVLREELKVEIQRNPGGADLAAVEGRIDEMALLSCDLFVRCREQMDEIKANEASRKTYLPDRIEASKG